MFLYKLFESWGPQQFEQHFKDIQKFYRERRDMMLTMVKKHLNGILKINFKRFFTVREKFKNNFIGDILRKNKLTS